MFYVISLLMTLQCRNILQAILSLLILQYKKKSNIDLITKRKYKNEYWDTKRFI